LVAFSANNLALFDLSAFLQLDDLGTRMHRVNFQVNKGNKIYNQRSDLLLAVQALKTVEMDNPLLEDIKIPKTWYFTSDIASRLIGCHKLEDLMEQNHYDLREIQHKDPCILDVFKNQPPPEEMINTLSLALDDIGDVPLIVRSTSLFQEQPQSSDKGELSPIYIPNQGTRKKRLAELVDAIKTILSSRLEQDQIEKRNEEGREEDQNEITILIQEVVGAQVGPYYLPAFAGVGFSKNEFRWSSRIKYDDGLVIMVPGLGTRAIDRMNDDYPAVIVPGQPGLRVNVSAREILRYSPAKAGVINLETRKFEIIEFGELLKAYGKQYPLAQHIISIRDQDYIRNPGFSLIDFQNEEFIVSFEGLFIRTPFLKRIQALFEYLQEALGYPVEIEFAHDGTDLYLLQCRAQWSKPEKSPPDIPQTIALENIIFTATHDISNASLTNIKYLVYVDPQKYSELVHYEEMLLIGRAIGKLNQELPRRKFILIGPGRWGSKGDIRLGVNVLFPDINNTLMLIEIARWQGEFKPEPSFGNHFFLDLVKSSIHYLALYPDRPGNTLNDQVLTSQSNQLEKILPEYKDLGEIIKVIDFPRSFDGKALQIWMNAEQQKALAALVLPENED
jgi:pyruvate, water dikinase